MLESCRFAISEDNPDSGTLRTSLELLVTTLLAVILWNFCYFPGLLIDLMNPDHALCPSMVNATWNEMMCSEPERYGTCIFGKLNLCNFYGFLFTSTIGLVVYCVVILVLLYRRRKSFSKWKGSLWKTLVFALIHSEENPDGLFLRVHQEDDFDREEFYHKRCCGYVAKRAVWLTLLHVVFATVTIILVILYVEFVCMPFGYLVNRLFLSENSVCFQYTLNMTVSQCFSSEDCNKKCGQDGGTATFISLFFVILFIAFVLIIRKCLTAFKSNEEITMLKGELQPLVNQSE